MMSALPARYNLVIWEGATFKKVITLLSSDVSSSPRDLTGYTAVLNIRTAPDTTPVYVLSTTNSQISLGGLLGTIALSIPSVDTLTFDSWEAGVYDLTITNTGGSGDTEALLWGNVRVRGVA